MKMASFENIEQVRTGQIVYFDDVVWQIQRVTKHNKQASMAPILGNQKEGLRIGEATLLSFNDEFIQDYKLIANSLYEYEKGETMKSFIRDKRKPKKDLMWDEAIGKVAVKTDGLLIVPMDMLSSEVICLVFDARHNTTTISYKSGCAFLSSEENCELIDMDDITLAATIEEKK